MSEEVWVRVLRKIRIFDDMKRALTLISTTLLFAAACKPHSPNDLPANPFGHALIPDMVADASICEFDGRFYCYATTDGYGRGLATSGPPIVWTSTDFEHWSFEGNYFPSAAGQKYWAPSKAVQVGELFYIYPTVNGYMYPAVATSPTGPFKLARGEDRFELPYTSSTLLQGDNPSGIDAEIFIDDDLTPYVFWGRRHVAQLSKDMTRIEGPVRTITTKRTPYSEGPIFFKRNNIYYYLYTIGGDEKYQYAYGMSRISPFGPYEFPEQDIISSTNYDTGVFGPGHGCVFQPQGSDDYFFAYLEFGRRSTNRQSYVNRLYFNEDGTIRPIDLHLGGVGPLRKSDRPRKLPIASVSASSTAEPLQIKYMKDSLCRRTEYFVPGFASDGANGSRWMAADSDSDKWIVADLGRIRSIKGSEVWFVRPSAGHAYKLEGSKDGEQWQVCGGSPTPRQRSPHSDDLAGQRLRYLRLSITEGVAGIWEWHIF